MEIAQKIRIIRQLNNLTQEDLANQLHVSRKTVSAWENKRAVPDYQILESISEQFNIQIEFLLDNSLSVKQFIFLINKKSKTIIHVLILCQLILIILEYLTLFNFFNIGINSILLIFNDFFLYWIIPSYNFLYSKPSKKILGIQVIFFTFLFNAFIGFRKLFVSNNLTNGTILGKIFVLNLLTLSIYIVYYFVSVKRRGYNNMWDFLKDFFKQLR